MTHERGIVYVFFGSGSIAGTKNLGTSGSPDVTFFGKNVSNEYFGRNANSAGDVNADGIDDIIIGAHNNDDGGGALSERGAAYIFFGSTTLNGTIDLSGTSSADVTFLGRADNNIFGQSVSWAGDVNGDGFDDVVIGAPSASSNGAAYVFFGAGNLSGTKNLAGVASADFTLRGKALNDNLGDANAVSGAGDFNGDGFDDIVVGAFGVDEGGITNTGAAYVIFGSSSLSGTRDLSATSSADFTVTGKANTDQLGDSVSGGGDFNGDGFDDIVVGAYLANGDGTDRGSVYVFFGGDNVANVTKTLRTGDVADLSFIGKKDSDLFGRSATFIGDFNDDGFDDIGIGADGNDEQANASGATYIFFGNPSLSGTQDLAKTASPDITITASTTSDSLGRSTAGIGDVNQDGVADMATGAIGYELSGASDRGAVFVIFGGVNKSGAISTLTAADVAIHGKVDSDNMGRNIGGGK